MDKRLSKADLELREMVQLLLARFPEFDEWGKNEKSLDEDDGAYACFFLFFWYLETLVENKKGAEIIDRAFDFINEVFESDKFTASIWDLFGIELFDQFDYHKNWGEMAHKKLKGKALVAFAEQKGRQEDDEYHWSNQFLRTMKKRKRKT